MDGSSGPVSLNDSEPLEIKKHAPIQVENIDMRINILKEYISKSPNATLKDLKKSLDGFSKFNDDEFLNLLKEANIDKYNEIKVIMQPKPATLESFDMPKKLLKKSKLLNLPDVDLISTDTIKCGDNFNPDEVDFLLKCSSLKPRHIFPLYKQAFPNSERNEQFVTDFRYNVKHNPGKYIKTQIAQTPSQPVVKHVKNVTKSQPITQIINSLYKSGYTPDSVPTVRTVINELLSENSDYAKIELAIAYLKP